MLRQCDWCGDDIQTNHPNSDPYVINAEHKIFCKIHIPGQEPIKDCLEDSLRSKKNVRKNELWQEKANEEKKENDRR